MSGLPRERAVLLLLIGIALLSGCAREGAFRGRRVTRDPNAIVVFAACAMAPAVEAAAARFEEENPGRSVAMETGEPEALMREIADGAVPDIFICLGDAEISFLEREGLLDPSLHQSVGEFSLVVAVPREREGTITTYRDLTSSEVRRVAMAAPGSTSLGTDGKKALERLGLWEDLQDKLVLTETPRAAVEALAEGEADVGVIVDPCPLLTFVETELRESVIPAAALAQESERAVRVHIGTHKRSPNALLAQRLVRVLTQEELWREVREQREEQEEYPGAEEQTVEGDAAE
jgi:molybdate transport system substrate-binding protein